MVAPSGEGAERSMKLATATIGDRKVGYINAHGTSTPAGDVTEVKAVRNVFGEGNTPPITSTKSLTGHCLGGAGVHEAIYSLIMLGGDFIAPSANITELDPAINAGEIQQTFVKDAGLDTVISNSFGFGGTNGTIAMSKYHG
jgi:3-oxoacyl-[acyl-carrier-protein] synthase-1